MIMSESVGDKVRKPVNKKALGVVYLLIALLVISVGYIAHITQTTVFDISNSDRIFEQLDLFFVEYVLIGFFSGMFLVLGIAYLKQEKQA